MKTRTIFLTAFIAWASPEAFSQTKDLVLIMTHQTGGGAGAGEANFMIITHPDLSTTRVDLQPVNAWGKNVEANLVTMAAQLKKLLDEGYEIESCSTADFRTLIILTRTRRE